ncbi:SDR family NAD(P)-dependent oxidoreductase [Oceanicola sp. S124]|uniref:SDR family NAD(P)-dependent oxidoreductase n=1 Tax=Oceanicola sp. S124 TaxID=1042378 RepID=UPI000255896A|nr:SDR family oxidoreductase [Oceanicola sp. S124]
MSTRPLFLITGGNRGLGRTMAEHLARGGADILITTRGDASEALAAIAAEGAEVCALTLDVAEAETFPAFAETLRATLSEMGRDTLTGVIHNAGIGLYAPLAETPVETFDTLYRIHLRGPAMLTQALLPQIADGGRILFISTGLARFSLPGYGAYASMKGAVEVMTRYWARELAERGISVNALAPGAIETDFGGGRTRDDAQVNAAVASFTAMGRAGLPDDIGAAAAALLLSDGNWVTGQRIEASGGMFL